MDQSLVFTKTFATEPRKTRLRKVAFQVHLFAGLGIALMMVAMGLSGSAIALREPIQFTLHRVSSSPTDGAPPASIDKALHEFASAHPDKDIAALIGVDRADGVLAIQTKDESGGPDRFFFLNRQTGALVSSHEGISHALDYLDDFHRNLLSGRRGRAFNGIVAVLFFFTTSTGLVVWWPGASRWTRSIFVNPNLSWKRITYDLHSAVGFYCFLFLFLMSFTAVFLATPSVPDLFRGTEGESGHHHHDHGSSKADRDQSSRPGDSAHSPHRAPDDPLAESAGGVDKLFAALPKLLASSGERCTAVELNSSGVPVRLELRHGWRTVIADWDAQTGTIIGERESSIPGTSLDAHGLADAFHFGRLAGIWSQTLWSILGLSPVLLALTGVLMWWNRVLSKRLRKR